MNEVYQSFVDYVLQDNDLTDIKKIISYNQLSNAWLNDTSKISSSDLLIWNNNKKYFNEYKHSNISLLGPNAVDDFLINQLTISGQSNINLLTSRADTGSNINSYINSLSGQKLINFNIKNNRVRGLVYNRSSNSSNLIANDSYEDVSSSTYKITPGVNHDVFISNSFQLSSSDSNHDITNHNSNNRRVVNAAYLNDKYIMSLDGSNNIIVTSSDNTNYPTTNINVLNKKYTQIYSNNNIFILLDSDNNTYLLDTNSNNTQIFNNLKIIKISVSVNYVTGLDSSNNLYLINLNNLTSVTSIASGVFSFCSNDNWIFILYTSGLLDYHVIGSLDPNIISSITNYTYQPDRIIKDIVIYDNLPFIIYL